MRTLLLLAVMAVAAPAVAGPYAGAGIGHSAMLHGDFEANFDSHHHQSSRFVLGQRIGPFAVEGSYAGAGLNGRSDMFAVDGTHVNRTLGADLKLYLGVAPLVDLYVKGGVTRTWLDSPDRSGHRYAGNGWEMGGGLQAGVDLIAAGVYVFLDYTHQTTELRDVAMGDKPTLDGSFGLASIGLAVSVF